MSIARHHNEWLSLLEVSGPFLSLPVLMRIFPQGLEEQDGEARKNLRIAHDEWEADGHDPAIHTAWLAFVLGTALEYPENYLLSGQAIPPGLDVRVPEHGEIIRPTWVLKAPEGRGAAEFTYLRVSAWLNPDDMATSE